MQYRVTKVFGPETGTSCCFRQWRAEHSHCRFIHGYALTVRLEFVAETLDARNWVIDFGTFKHVKAWIKETFDHKLLVAQDDPQRAAFTALGNSGLAQVRFVENVGIEAFSKMTYEFVSDWLSNANFSNDVALDSVAISEHTNNTAAIERSPFSRQRRLSGFRSPF